jgi:tRNA dimethylallyltransferase
MSLRNTCSTLVILGPTASGKTTLALELAHKFEGAVISADSRQIYSELNIGTAKPKEAWRDTPHPPNKADLVDGIPHYLLNVAAPDLRYTLAEWQREAYRLMTSLCARTIKPVIAGGTMLYIDSLIYNFSIPPVAPNETLRTELEALATTELYARLLAQDTAAQEFVEPHHRRRIIRALEVIQSTGQPFSSLRQSGPSPFEFILIGLFPGWVTLKANIRQRSEQMLNEGLLDETRRLQERYSTELALLKTINYQQAAEVAAGKKTPQQAQDDMVQASMRYAHRQMSWWKRNKKIQWFESPAEAAEKIGRT